MRPSRAAALHLALAVVATFPLVTDPVGRLVGHPDVDVWNHAWGAWWFWRSFTEGVLPSHTTLLGAPDGGTLWYIDPIGAILGMPLVPVLGVVGAYNAVILLEVALTSVAARSLALALGATPRASWLAAVAMALSPYLLSEIHNGVSEAVGVPWSLFALAAGRRALDRGGVRRWVTTGALLALTAVGTWYYGFGAALTLGTWAVFAPKGRRRAAWVGLLGAGALALVLAAVPLRAAYASANAPDGLVVRGEMREADRELLLTHNAVDPRAYVAPGGFQSVDLAARGEAFRHSSYVGLVALLLALTTRRWGVLVGVLPAAVLSLGPWLWWDGDWVRPSDGYRLSLPFRWVMEVLPGSAATHAQRVGMPVLPVVAALAAVALVRLPRRAVVPLSVLVALDALASGPWPLARAPRVDTALHASLASRPAVDTGPAGPALVLDLPGEVDATMATSRYLYYQTASGLPIPYRPDARAGTASYRDLAAFQVLVLPSLYRPEHREAMERQLGGVADVDLRALASAVRWIVVHRELERGRQGTETIEAQLSAWFGEPEVSGTHALWDTRRSPVGRGRVVRR